MRDVYTVLATMVAHDRISMSNVTQVQAENLKSRPPPNGNVGTFFAKGRSLLFKKIISDVVVTYVVTCQLS